MPELEPALSPDLKQLERRQLRRSRRVLEAGTSLPHALIDGREVRVFCSNDYLGLAHDPRLAETMARAALEWGTGAGAAHLVSGHTAAHHALEEALAAFAGRERALLFSTGYMANLGVLSALAGRGDLVVEDRLNHASLIDATRLCGARVRRYRHADAAAAAERLGAPARRRLLVTDGLFSMDGDVAPLAELAAVAEASGAWLMVDDAHGLGVLGDTGRGSLEAAGLSTSAAPVLVGTLGKAFGVFGAFAAGSAELIETLINRARTYIYTTAPPPGIAAAAHRALTIAAQEPWRRQHLRHLISRFRDGAARLGLELMPSDSPIQPILVGTPKAALGYSEALFEKGFWVAAIRPPTVPEGTARLRVTLSAAHREQDVDDLLDAITATDMASAAA
ncbi:MAG: 8-amino-7-oxononanoate synthase [Gammaproteobacteria bacterium]|jgi:8-amino-7-oxononanoate synthase